MSQDRNMKELFLNNIVTEEEEFIGDNAVKMEKLRIKLKMAEMDFEVKMMELKIEELKIKHNKT